VLRLAAEFDVAKATMRAALRIIEAEGLIAKAGQRGARVVVNHRGGNHAVSSGPLRVCILMDRPMEAQLASEREFLLKIQLGVQGAGYSCFFAPKTQVELAHNTARIARFAREVEAEAWIILNGRANVLEWFANQKFPALALDGADVPGIVRVSRNMQEMLLDATLRLTQQGHRRITFLLGEPFQSPHSPVSKAILSRFAALQIPSSAAYNTPVWEETEEGLYQVLDALFRVTPPTALFVQDMRILLSTLTFMASRGIRVPGQVSLIAGFCDGEIEWTASAPAHYRTDTELLRLHVIRWVQSVANGSPSTESYCAPLEFVLGSSLTLPDGRRAAVPQPNTQIARRATPVESLATK
jgi:Transcriptional regulators